MDKGKLESEFQKAGITIPFRLYGSLDSTNSFAKTLEPPCVIIALRQTSGRGRGGKAFISPPGGLYFSILLSKDFIPAKETRNFSIIPLICGMAIAGRIEGAKVKWPNDIYLSGGGSPDAYFKAAGILCEASGAKFVIGAGLNVNTKSFPEEIKDKASSLAVLHGREYGMEETAASVISAVLRNIRDERYYSDGAFLAGRFAEYDFLKGRKIRVMAGNETAEGAAGGIDGSGRLRLLCGREVRSFICGEVSLSMEYGILNIEY